MFFSFSLNEILLIIIFYANSNENHNNDELSILHKNENELIENKKKKKALGKKHHLIINAEGVGHSYGMAKRIEQATGVETRASILGHMQRGGNPTAKDRVYASYMGALAVDLLCSGATNRVVGYRNGQYIDYDIEDALGMAKDVDQYEFEIAQILGR